MTPYSYATNSHRLQSVGTVGREYDANGNTVLIGVPAPKTGGEEEQPPPGDPGPGDPPPGGGETQSAGAAAATAIRSFVYDAANRMAEVRHNGTLAASYRYNGKGERVRKTAPDEDIVTVYDEAGRWLGDYQSNGQPLQQAIWLDDLPVGLIVGAGSQQKLYYIQADALGTPRVIIDPDRDVAVWRWEMQGEAFGDDAPNQDPDNDGIAFVFDLRFPGQRYDSATGMNYNYFRDYDVATGRYSQSDPIGLAGGISTYGYVGGNPLGRIDPLGLADSSSPWSVGWEWLTGRGPRHREFNDGDPFAETLRRHGNIQRLLKRACEGTIPKQGKWDYSVSGWKGVPLYLHDYSNLLTGGNTGNIAVTYLGSYNVRFQIGANTLYVQVNNSSSIQSATHPPVIGYTRWWSENVGDPLNHWRSTGAMSEITQAFNLTFDLSECGCKK